MYIFINCISLKIGICLIQIGMTFTLTDQINNLMKLQLLFNTKLIQNELNPSEGKWSDV